MARMLAPTPKGDQCSPLSALCRPAALNPANTFPDVCGWKVKVKTVPVATGLVHVLPPSILLKIPWPFAPLMIVVGDDGSTATVSILIAGPTCLHVVAPSTVRKTPPSVA